MIAGRSEMDFSSQKVSSLMGINLFQKPLIRVQLRWFGQYLFADKDITFILVHNASKALGIISSNFYSNPSKNKFGWCHRKMAKPL